MQRAAEIIASTALALLLGGCAHVRQQVPTAAPPRSFAEIDGIAAREVANGHVAGAVIIVGGPSGVYYRRAFGDRTVAPSQDLMTADTIFDLASLTKVTATTTAIMQLVENRQLSLNARVVDYWPQFGANGKDTITIEQLLTHMSGLRPDINTTVSWSGDGAALARIVADSPISPPGERFIYSDINFIVLGELVRRLSGESLDSYSHRHIFAPLRMNDTEFNPDNSKHSRIAPTERDGDAWRQGRVQDPTAARMGGVAGHAGLFSTADDLARFAEMLLGNGTRQGVRIMRPETVRRMISAETLPGGVKRGLGWDMASAYQAGMGDAFGPGSFGHTGYTGTAIWIDPATKTYLIVLASRLYPDGRGDVSSLRGQTADAVMRAYRASRKVLPGVDVLAEDHFAPLQGLRIGLLTNQSGIDLEGHRTIDVLAQATGVHLVAIFSPEHGLGTDQEGNVASSKDGISGLPIYSLYDRSRRPTAEMMKGLDAVVVDLQDAGARFYTYPTTVAYVMEEAAKAHLKVFILDRPNPIGAAGVRGPLLDSAFQSFTGYFPMPVQHGMTLGELAMMFNSENQIGVDLTVVPMRGYRSASWYDDTGLSWINPSPNLRSLTEAVLYPGVGMVEGTNLSVGRGTDTPFEILGAPWIDAAKLTHYLTERRIAGVRFQSTQFTPTADRYAGEVCHGIRIAVVDRAAIDAPHLGIELAAAMHRLYPELWDIAPMLDTLGSRSTFVALDSGQDPKAIAATWAVPIHDFALLRAKYHLY